MAVKKCPRCGNYIRDTHKKCFYCGFNFRNLNKKNIKTYEQLKNQKRAKNLNKNKEKLLSYLDNMDDIGNRVLIERRIKNKEITTIEEINAIKWRKNRIQEKNKKEEREVKRISKKNEYKERERKNELIKFVMRANLPIDSKDKLYQKINENIIMNRRTLIIQIDNEKNKIRRKRLSEEMKEEIEWKNELKEYFLSSYTGHVPSTRQKEIINQIERGQIKTKKQLDSILYPKGTSKCIGDAERNENFKKAKPSQSSGPEPYSGYGSNYWKDLYH